MHLSSYVNTILGVFSMDIGVIVSTNLRKIRAEKGYSLTKLSELSGVSKGMLSQIENNGTSPTINTIWKICSGLGIPYTALLEDQPTESAVISKAQTSRQESENGHYRIFGYYPDSPHHNFELFQMELDPQSAYTSIGHSKVNRNGESEEYVMVIQGELTIDVSDKHLELGPDDATKFNSTRRHIYRNSGPAVVKAVIINFYPV